MLKWLLPNPKAAPKTLGSMCLAVPARNAITMVSTKVSGWTIVAAGRRHGASLGILKAEFDRSQLQLYDLPASGGEPNSANVIPEIEAFTNFGVSRGLGQQKKLSSCKSYRTNVLKVFCSRTTASNKHQVPALADTFVNTALCYA